MSSVYLCIVIAFYGIAFWLPQMAQFDLRDQRHDQRTDRNGSSACGTHELGWPPRLRNGVKHIGSRCGRAMPELYSIWTCSSPASILRRCVTRPASCLPGVASSKGVYILVD